MDTEMIGTIAFAIMAVTMAFTAVANTYLLCKMYILLHCKTETLSHRKSVKINAKLRRMKSVCDILVPCSKIIKEIIFEARLLLKENTHTQTSTQTSELLSETTPCQCDLHNKRSVETQTQEVMNEYGHGTWQNESQRKVLASEVISEKNHRTELQCGEKYLKCHLMKSPSSEENPFGISLNFSGTIEPLDLSLRSSSPSDSGYSGSYCHGKNQSVSNEHDENNSKLDDLDESVHSFDGNLSDVMSGVGQSTYNTPHLDNQESESEDSGSMSDMENSPEEITEACMDQEHSGISNANNQVTETKLASNIGNFQYEYDCYSSTNSLQLVVPDNSGQMIEDCVNSKEHSENCLFQSHGLHAPDFTNERYHKAEATFCASNLIQQQNTCKSNDIHHMKTEPIFPERMPVANRFEGLKHEMICLYNEAEHSTSNKEDDIEEDGDGHLGVSGVVIKDLQSNHAGADHLTHPAESWAIHSQSVTHNQSEGSFMQGDNEQLNLFSEQFSNVESQNPKVSKFYENSILQNARYDVNRDNISVSSESEKKRMHDRNEMTFGEFSFDYKGDQHHSSKYQMDIHNCDNNVMPVAGQCSSGSGLQWNLMTANNGHTDKMNSPAVAESCNSSFGQCYIPETSHRDFSVHISYNGQIISSPEEDAIENKDLNMDESDFDIETSLKDKFLEEETQRKKLWSSAHAQSDGDCGLSIDGGNISGNNEDMETVLKSLTSLGDSCVVQQQSLCPERQVVTTEFASIQKLNAKTYKEEMRNVLGIDLRVDDVLEAAAAALPFNLHELDRDEGYNWQNLPSEHYEDFEDSGFIHPLRQRNRPIYDQLKQIDFVMGYFSTGQSIDVFVNIDGLDPDFYLQQICQITGQPPSKFHIKDNNENWSLGNN